MAKFIELTDKLGNKFTVNADNCIDIIRVRKSIAEVVFHNSGDVLAIKESYDEVKKLLGVE